jgi:hypothetical protein
MEFAGFEHFCGFHDPLSSRAFRGRFEPHEVALGLSRGELVTNPTVTVGWAMGGGEPSDIIWTTSAAPVVLHRKVIELLSSAGFSGWHTYPVEVRNKAGVLVSDYEGLAIVGRCDSMDLDRSEIILEQMPGGWIPRFKGRYFDPASWDGTDMFMERPDSLGRMSGTRFATERVVKALKRARIRNLGFIAAPDEVVDAAVYTIGLRHRLPKDYGDRLDRAYRAANVPRPLWV